jgi:ABC-type multidrug transport system fused ATPase/permease subunit
MPALSNLPYLLTRYLRQFWSYVGGRMLVLVALTITMSFAEGIGIAMFFPLFSTATPSGGDGAWNPITAILHAFDISPTPASVLPLIMVLYVTKGLLQYLTYRYQYSLTRMVSRRLRRRALTALSKADYQHVAGTSAGFFSNFVINEVARAAGGFGYFVKSLSPLLSAGVLFLMVCLLDWRLSLVCVAMGFVMIALTRVTGFVVRRYSIVVTNETGKLTSLLIQVLHGFKYLRATGSYERFDRRVEQTSDKILDADFKASNANAFLLAMSQPIMVVFLGGILYFRAVIQGAELASLFVLLLFFFRVMNEVFQLQSNWQTFCGLIGSVDLVRDATAETEAAAEAVGGDPYAGLRDAIVLDKVGFSYKTGRPVLHDISLRIPAKTTVALVGGSGAGKSTLVDLVTGTLKASSGRITIDGKDIMSVDLASLRKHIGYVPQDAVLFDDTVAANIALWSEGYTRDQIRDAAARAKCLEFIENMPEGFDTEIGDRGVKLSGGQRQRLAIARELIRQPDLLVLDEATSALDSESEVAIQQSIDQLRGKMTIIMIAHRLSTIRSSDQVYVLANGSVVEHGGFTELAARPGGHFHRMCELQELA